MIPRCGAPSWSDPKVFSQGQSREGSKKSRAHALADVARTRYGIKKASFEGPFGYGACEYPLHAQSMRDCQRWRLSQFKDGARNSETEKLFDALDTTKRSQEQKRQRFGFGGSHYEGFGPVYDDGYGEEIWDSPPNSPRGSKSQW